MIAPEYQYDVLNSSGSSELVKKNELVLLFFITLMLVLFSYYFKNLKVKMSYQEITIFISTHMFTLASGYD